MSKKLGLIGPGVVGKAVKAYFPDMKVYDKYNASDELSEVLDADIIFITVPTPYKNGYDKSHIEDAFSNFTDTKGKIIVIKSTVVPGTTDAMQAKYPQHYIMFNPEFLTARTAAQDFAQPDKQIVGFTDMSKPMAQDVLDILPNAPYSHLMRATEAELFKYAINNFYAMKVSYANQLYDLAEALNVDYEPIRQSLVADRYFQVDMHMDVHHGGSRGFSNSHCLPKDLNAMIDHAESLGVNPVLYKAVKYYNDDLARRQGLTENDGSNL